MKKKIIKLKKTSFNDLNKEWVSWLNNRNTNKNFEKKNKKHTLKSQKEYLIDVLQDQTKIHFMIILNKKKIGTMLVSKISKKNRHCEISYMIGLKENWNKGIGFEAIKLVKKFILMKIKLKKMYAGIRSDNIGSKKILIKNKFKLEAKLKDYIYEKNVFYDRYIYSFIKK